MIKPLVKVSSVKPLENYRLQVALSNGRKGVFDMSPYLDKGVFKQLKDPAYFALAKKWESGVGWPCGQDIGPCKIAHEMRPLPRRASARKSVLPKKRD